VYYRMSTLKNDKSKGKSVPDSQALGPDPSGLGSASGSAPKEPTSSAKNVGHAVGVILDVLEHLSRREKAEALRAVNAIAVGYGLNVSSSPTPPAPTSFAQAAQPKVGDVPSKMVVKAQSTSSTKPSVEETPETRPSGKRKADGNVAGASSKKKSSKSVPNPANRSSLVVGLKAQLSAVTAEMKTALAGQPKGARLPSNHVLAVRQRSIMDQVQQAKKAFRAFSGLHLGGEKSSEAQPTPRNAPAGALPDINMLSEESMDFTHSPFPPPAGLMETASEQQLAALRKSASADRKRRKEEKESKETAK